MEYKLKFENGRSCEIYCESDGKPLQDKINAAEERFGSQVKTINGKEVKEHGLGGFLVGAIIGGLAGNAVAKQGVKKTIKSVARKTTSTVKRAVDSVKKKEAPKSKRSNYIPNRLIDSIETKSGKTIENKDIIDGAHTKSNVLVSRKRVDSQPKDIDKSKKLSLQTDYLSARKIKLVNTTYGRKLKGSEILDGAYVKKGVFADGGSIDSFNFKKFKLDELIAILPEDVQFMWMHVEGDDTYENYIRSYGPKYKSVKNTYWTITDYSKFELSKGEENIYLDMMVYKEDIKAPEVPYTISLYTKDNHLGLKNFAAMLIQKFKDGGSISEKVYYETPNVGSSKYTVSYYDGKKTNSDGSPFYDIAIFKSKLELNKFLDKLKSEGYRKKFKDGGSTESRPNFSSMSKEELIDYSKKNNIPYATGWSTEKLIDTIEDTLDSRYAKGGGVRKAPFKVGDMVYSYQNPNHKMRISFVEDRGVIDGVDYGWGIKVALKTDSEGNYNPKGTYSKSSKWMSQNSVSKVIKEKYAEGGKMAKGGGVGKLTEKDFIESKQFVRGNTLIKLKKLSNPNYYRADYIDIIENEKIGSYGSANLEDVLYDINNTKYSKGGGVDSKRYKVIIYHGGEQRDQVKYASTLEEARELSFQGEHSEIVDTKTNTLVYGDGGSVKQDYRIQFINPETDALEENIVSAYSMDDAAQKVRKQMNFGSDVRLSVIRTNLGDDKYTLEQDKDGSWQVLDNSKDMYVDRVFDSKDEAESFIQSRNNQRKLLGFESYFAKGGRIDLFETPDEIPSEVQAIMSEYELEDNDYQILEELQGRLETETGYTFDFGLDGTPYGLRPVGVSIEEIQNSEMFAKVGGVDSKREYLENRLWNERGYEYTYLNKLSFKELRSLYDTEFYYDETYAKGGLTEHGLRLGDEIVWVDNFELDQDKKNRAKYIINYNRGNYTIIDNKTKKAITSFPTQISAVNYINTELNKFAKGGMTEHGLRLGDKILKDAPYKLSEYILVEDKRENKHFVDLNRGERGKAFAKGGVIGQEITFNHWSGDVKRGTIDEVHSTGDYIVQSGFGSMLVNPDDVISISSPEKEKRFLGIFEDGGFVPNGYVVVIANNERLEFPAKYYIDESIQKAILEDIDFEGSPDYKKLYNYISKEFNEWIENSRDYEDMYYGDGDQPAMFDKSGAIWDAIHTVIFEDFVQKNKEGKYAVINLDKYESDFISAFEYEKGGKLKYAKGGGVDKYSYNVLNENTDEVYFRSPDKTYSSRKFEEFREMYPKEKISLYKVTAQKDGSSLYKRLRTTWPEDKKPNPNQKFNGPNIEKKILALKRKELIVKKLRTDPNGGFYYKIQTKENKDNDAGTGIGYSIDDFGTDSFYHHSHGSNDQNIGNIWHWRGDGKGPRGWYTFDQDYIEDLIRKISANASKKFADGGSVEYAKGGGIDNNDLIKIPISNMEDSDFQSLQEICESNDIACYIDESEMYLVTDLEQLKKPFISDRDIALDIIEKYNVEKMSNGGAVKKKSIDFSVMYGSPDWNSLSYQQKLDIEMNRLKEADLEIGDYVMNSSGMAGRLTLFSEKQAAKLDSPVMVKLDKPSAIVFGYDKGWIGGYYLAFRKGMFGDGGSVDSSLLTAEENNMLKLILEHPIFDGYKEIQTFTSGGGNYHTMILLSNNHVVTVNYESEDIQYSFDTYDSIDQYLDPEAFPGEEKGWDNEYYSPDSETRTANANLDNIPKFFDRMQNTFAGGGKINTKLLNEIDPAWVDLLRKVLSDPIFVDYQAISTFYDDYDGLFTAILLKNNHIVYIAWDGMQMTYSYKEYKSIAQFKKGEYDKEMEDYIGFEDIESGMPDYNKRWFSFYNSKSSDDIRNFFKQFEK
jgi:hypothetical protein